MEIVDIDFGIKELELVKKCFPLSIRLKWLCALVVLVIMVIVYALFSHYFVYSSDAYVEAHVIPIAAEVNGKIVKRYVQDLQYVKTGDKLLEIDPTSYQYDVIIAKDLVALNKTKYESLKAQIKSAQSAIAKAEAGFSYQKKEWERYQALSVSNTTSKSRAGNAYYQFQQAKADLATAKQHALEIQAKLGGNATTFPPLEAARANLNKAKLALSHTIIYALHNGYVTNLRTATGDYVKTGEQLFGIVDTSHWWVLARIKESYLTKFKTGDHVDIWLKMDPGFKFKGRVYGTAWGVNRKKESANNSILPYYEKTQAWIELDQRFPVRIDISTLDPDHPLRIGASARVLIKR